MIIRPIEMANYELVEVKNGTPHCKIHGAMNKVSVHEDGGGYWRCITAISDKKEGACRAGCEEVRMKPVGNVKNLEESHKVKSYMGNTKELPNNILLRKRS